MKLKFSGKDYAYGSNILIIAMIDLNEEFSIEHYNDMTIVHYQDGSLIVEKNSLTCEVIY